MMTVPVAARKNIKSAVVNKSDKRLGFLSQVKKNLEDYAISGI